MENPACLTFMLISIIVMLHTCS